MGAALSTHVAQRVDGKVMTVSGAVGRAAGRTQLEQSDANGATGSKSEGSVLGLRSYTSVLGLLFYHLLCNAKT